MKSAIRVLYVEFDGSFEPQDRTRPRVWSLPADHGQVPESSLIARMLPIPGFLLRAVFAESP
jgi:hypothetical protein